MYGPLVYRWVRQAGVMQGDAEDLVQEVFIAVAHSIPHFSLQSGTGSFRRWLWGITHNKVKQHFRRVNREPRGTGGTEAQIQIRNQPELLAEASSPKNGESETDSVSLGFDEDASLLHRAMGLLKSDFEEHTWRAFWRMAVDGQSSADVAEELGMTKKAVRQAKYRVLRRLRAELDAWSGEQASEN